MKKTNLTITEMVADIESRLTVGPDGLTAVAPSGERYVTFHLGRPTDIDDDGYKHDIEAELIAALWGVLTTYKTDQAHIGGKFIRWRKRPVIDITNRFRLSILCRVLISAAPESIFEIVEEEKTLGESAPRIMPVPEPCSRIMIRPNQWVDGYLGHSGTFYDKYGRKLPTSQEWKYP